MTSSDYHALGRLVGVHGVDPGVTLRRHHLLAMETPLQLLQRVDGRSWDRIALTSSGVSLATSPNPTEVLDIALNNIIFCTTPYYTTDRVSKFRDFAVRPYQVALQVLDACQGWIDREEYDLFLSRIRNTGEVDWAVHCIRDFRTIPHDEKQQLLNQVRVRVPGGRKRYQNWRDMGLHTFSFLSLGKNIVRANQRIVFSEPLSGEGSLSGSDALLPLLRLLRLKRLFADAQR